MTYILHHMCQWTCIRINELIKWPCWWITKIKMQRNEKYVHSNVIMHAESMNIITPKWPWFIFFPSLLFMMKYTSTFLLLSYLKLSSVKSLIKASEACELIKSQTLLISKRWAQQNLIARPFPSGGRNIKRGLEHFQQIAYQQQTPEQIRAQNESSR